MDVVNEGAGTSGDVLPGDTLSGVDVGFERFDAQKESGTEVAQGLVQREVVVSQEEVEEEVEVAQGLVKNVVVAVNDGVQKEGDVAENVGEDLLVSTSGEEEGIEKVEKEGVGNGGFKEVDQGVDLVVEEEEKDVDQGVDLVEKDGEKDGLPVLPGVSYTQVMYGPQRKPEELEDGTSSDRED